MFPCVSLMAGIGFRMKYVLVPGSARWIKYGRNVALSLSGWADMKVERFILLSHALVLACFFCTYYFTQSGYLLPIKQWLRLEKEMPWLQYSRVAMPVFNDSSIFY